MAQQPSSRKTVLVVEDDYHTREGLACLLGEEFFVRCAAHGEEALQYLRSNPAPDLILLDLMMPVLSGWEFRRRQLQEPALSGIPVVVLTALGDSGALTVDLGDVGYLHKPLEADQLFDTVRRFAAPVRPTALVVDDERLVRQLLDIALRRHGFDVRQAAGGAEAVELFRKDPGAYGVVLLDVQMPGGLDGPQTLAALREIDPSVPCCFMSGFTGHYTPDMLRGSNAAAVFSKPFSDLTALGRTLWDLAESRRIKSAIPGPPPT